MLKRVSGRGRELVVLNQLWLDSGEMRLLRRGIHLVIFILSIVINGGNGFYALIVSTGMAVVKKENKTNFFIFHKILFAALFFTQPCVTMAEAFE